MKTETTTRTVETFGVQSSVQFSIKQENTSHIFAILRNQLYSNKPLAVIREYSTNGWDAHIEAGTPSKPIQVTLPTMLNPVFKVRDFGVGLDDDGIMSIFASYGESTKRNSNEQVGMLGLGSKSAFCYGNAYEIASYFNGVRTLYTAYLDETNIGTIAQTLQEPTTEPNGIEITVAVRKEDISTFVATAKQFYTHFNPRPVFLGVTKEINEHIDVYANKLPFRQGAGWKMMGSRSGVSSVVIMGNVSYPLNGAIFTQSSEYNYRTLVDNGGLVLEAGIGNVMIVASREALEYNDRTKAWVKAKIDAIVKEVEAELQREMNNAPNLWTARMVYNTIKNQASWFTQMFPVNLTFKGKAVSDSFISTQTVDTVFSKGMGITFKTYDNFEKPRLKSSEVKTIAPSDKILFLLNKNNGAFPRSEISARIRGAHKAHPAATIVVVHFDVGDHSAAFMAHDEVIGAKCVSMEDYTPLRITTTGQSTTINYDRRKCKVFMLDRKVAGNYPKANSDAWDMEAEVDLDADKGVFVYINAFQPSAKETGWLGYNLNLNEFCRVLNEAEAAGVTLPPIYGIRDSVDKIGSKWIPLQLYVKNEVEKVILKNKLDEAWNRAEQLQTVPTHYLALVPYSADLPAGQLATFVQTVKRLKDDKDNAMVKNMQTFLKRITLGVKLTQAVPVNLSTEREAVEASYPMLRAILAHVGSHYLVGTYKVEFLKYLRDIEASKVAASHKAVHAVAVPMQTACTI